MRISRSLRFCGVLLSVSLEAIPAPTRAQTVSPPCIARPTARFHLRPQPTDQSIGVQVAAGTPLEVLALANYLRLNAILYRVRVTATGAVGYTFLRPSEFDAACPEPWLSDHPLYDRPSSQGWTLPGTAAPAAASIVPCDGVVTGPRADLDHDGRVDVLLTVQHGFRHGLVAVRHLVAGWQAQVVYVETEGDSCEWLAPAQRADETWAIIRCLGSTDSAYTDVDWAVYRLDARTGDLRQVGFLVGDRLEGGLYGQPHPNTWRFAAPGAGVLAVTGHRGLARRFNFDTARWVLTQ